MNNKLKWIKSIKSIKKIEKKIEKDDDNSIIEDYFNEDNKIKNSIINNLNDIIKNIKKQKSYFNNFKGNNIELLKEYNQFISKNNKEFINNKKTWNSKIISQKEEINKLKINYTN